MKRPAKAPVRRQVVGAKAPFILPPEEFKALASNIGDYLVANYIVPPGAGAARQTKIESIGSEDIIQRVMKPPQDRPPYKPRLDQLFEGLLEQEQMFHDFAFYLNPAPEPGGAATADQRGRPFGMDELVSALESQLNLNMLLLRDLRNKF